MMLFIRWKEGTWDMMMSLNGLLAGMIATCSCCNVIEVWAALVVGVTGAAVYYGQSYVTEHIFHVRAGTYCHSNFSLFAPFAS